MDNFDFSNKKITGHWGGQPIWRWKTPEERLEDTSNIKVDEVMVYLALLANKDNKNYGKQKHI